VYFRSALNQVKFSKRFATQLLHDLTTQPFHSYLDAHTHIRRHRLRHTQTHSNTLPHSLPFSVSTARSVWMVAAKIELAASNSLDSHVPQVRHSCCRPWTLILSHVSEQSHNAVQLLLCSALRFIILNSNIIFSLFDYTFFFLISFPFPSLFFSSSRALLVPSFFFSFLELFTLFPHLFLSTSLFPHQLSLFFSDTSHTSLFHRSSS
jgi:hypothetical protein